MSQPVALNTHRGLGPDELSRRYRQPRDAEDLDVVLSAYDVERTRADGRVRRRARLPSSARYAVWRSGLVPTWPRLGSPRRRGDCLDCPRACVVKGARRGEPDDASLRRLVRPPLRAGQVGDLLGVRRGRAEDHRRAGSVLSPRSASARPLQPRCDAGRADRARALARRSPSRIPESTIILSRCLPPNLGGAIAALALALARRRGACVETESRDTAHP